MKTLNKFKLVSILLVLLIGVGQLNAQCQASFTVTDNGNGNLSFTNTSTGNITYASWDFGDGNYDYTMNPNHTFVNGWYSVCLIAGDSISGCTSTYCDSVEITSGVNPPTCTVNVTHTVTDNGNGVYSFVSTATGGTPPYAYYWQFGDGTYDYTANPVHTYSFDDLVDVCVTVIDADSCLSVSCDSLAVTNTLVGNPCNSFAPSFSFVDNGAGNYDFTNTSSGNGDVYLWNFGDGNTSMDYNPNHTFAANGTYVVVLAVTDSAGNCVEYYNATISVTSVVNPTLCNAGFTMYTDSTFNGVYVINSSTGNNLTYFWDFGDGNTSTQAYPNYTYGTGGPFELCLTVTSDSLCTSTYCDSIGSGGVVLKQSGFDINVQSPLATAIEEEIELISNFNVYPNPFKNNVTIELDLIKESDVKINVTDLLGNVIATIADQEMIGRNKLQWKAENASNGVYLLNIITNNSLRVEKLILNR